MKNLRSCFIAFILFFLAAAPAFGATSAGMGAKATGINVNGLDGLFVATSGHTLEAQTFVLGAGFFYGSDDDFSTHALPITLTYGVVDNIEVGLSVAVISGVDPDGPGSESGVGDIGISGKYSFLEESDSVPGVAAGIRVKIPSADDSEGLGTGEFDLGLLLAASKKIGRTEYMLNVEYALIGGDNPDRPNEVNYALGARMSYTDTVSFTLELIDQNFVLSNFFAGDHLVTGAEVELMPGFMAAGNFGVAMTGGPVTDFVFGAKISYAF